MDGDAKLRYFQSLLSLGYKEIEVSYPSASQTEYEFTRRLITTPGLIPDDVWLQIMAPCREDLIKRTIDSARGAKKIILHIHLSTSDCFRDIVFNMSEQETIDLAVRCIRLIRELTKDSPDPDVRKTEWILEFTPENFQDTSVEFALEICETIKAVWQPTEQHKIIFNLPSTVEVAMPNTFADQIEFFCDHITERSKVCVSLHNHNDRGTAVATAELGQLAGADRIEGCLFGNGERTGNVDLVTLALNLYTQGVNPGIDFSNVNSVVAMVEELTKIPVHFRAPYAGKYTFCTFTGTHQDAIRKGYKNLNALQKRTGRAQKWRMPYLPMDPMDLGRKHEAIIRVNSQSGKSGIAWLVKEVFNIDMPRELEIAFTRIVKVHATDTGLEITPEVIENLFQTNYMLPNYADLELVTRTISEDESNVKSNEVDTKVANEQIHIPITSLNASFVLNGVQRSTCGSGNELLSTVVNAVKQLGFEFELIDHKTQLVQNSDFDYPSRTACFVKIHSEKLSPIWGVGIHKSPIWSTFQAVLGAAGKLAANEAVDRS
ncbi:2-isopropylmalate synthase [Talaromyces atroroseus]|uniref:2-isopropylmalate synthase n=1 Tax=Talaromyces atroroseus TaxID=1441469 RepID=A0A225ALW0_TALAT|nr:2-isopropylmalate synthase [Talaromyces atroroseus]OKL56549.1 2-isopropylmalate synthase [Talaromyces atroroseus]